MWTAIAGPAQTGLPHPLLQHFSVTSAAPSSCAHSVMIHRVNALSSFLSHAHPINTLLFLMVQLLTLFPALEVALKHMMQKCPFLLKNPALMASTPDVVKRLAARCPVMSPVMIDRNPNHRLPD